MTVQPVFDVAELFAAFDQARGQRGPGWYELAGELWQQSADLTNLRTAGWPTWP